MNEANWKKRLLSSTLFAGAMLGVSGAVAVAQEADDTAVATTTEEVEGESRQQRITVTGSRIVSPNLVLSSPVTVIDEDEILLQQPVSAEDLLRTLPGTTPSIGPQTNNGSNGSARVNLRGLGTNRNLVLLNGRRVTPRDTDGVVDLNIVPLALVERVDVLTGGASTAYGADAVSGVVNFITKSDFTGFDLRGSYGQTDRSDGDTFRIDMTGGASFDNGRGNAVLSLGYTKTDPVLQGDRDIGLVSRSSTCSAAQLATCGTLNVGSSQGSPTAAPASIGSPFVGSVSADGQSFNVGTLNDYNFNPINLFQSPLERYSLYGQTKYELTDKIEVYSEAMFVKTSVNLNLAPAGVFGSALQVPLNSPFLSAQQRTTLCTAAIGRPGGLPVGADCGASIAAGTQVTVGVLRRFTEAGPRVIEYDTNMFHFSGGIRGELTPSLLWDVSGAYGESDWTQARTGWGLLSRVRAGVLGCPAGSPAGCVPVNLFGPEGSITSQMLNYIDAPTYSFADTTFTTVQGSISGDVGVSSPFATTPIGGAVGVEYRQYNAGSRGDATSAIPGEVLGAGAAALPVGGSFDSYEAFFEVAVPILEDRPFVDSLSFEGGARLADYSTSGSNWTWNAGGSWAPVSDIKFRAVYAEAARAPNISELFQPQVTALTGRSSDPCQGTLANISARGSNFQALCLAQLAQVGAPASLLGTIPGPAAGQIQSTQGGNPDLDPEVATTTTIGVVFTPSFMPNITASIDYFKIKVEDAITTPSQSDVIDGCFQASPLAAQCSQIFRNPLTGSLSGPADTTFGPVLALSNLGLIETSGVDVSLMATHDFDLGRLSLAFNGTWTEEFLFQATPLSINRQCMGYYSVSCGTPQPEFGANTRATFSTDTTDLSVLWRYISSTEVEPRAPSPQAPVGTPTNAGPANIVGGYREIDAYNWIDLAARHRFGDNLTLTLTVQNLLDKGPPDVGNSIGTPASNSGNTFPTLYDPLGRRFTLGFNLAF